MNILKLICLTVLSSQLAMFGCFACGVNQQQGSQNPGSQTQSEHGFRSHLSSNSIVANQLRLNEKYGSDVKLNAKHGGRDCYQLANSGFSTMDPNDWYEINTQVYPNTVPLSLHRNKGFTKGDIHLKHNGMKVNKSGNYWATITAVVLNTSASCTPLIPVFLVKDGVFDPTDQTTIGGVATLIPNIVTTIQSSGILKNLKAGTKLSIVATNGGCPQPEPVTVIAWDISLFRIPCECRKKHRSHHHCHCHCHNHRNHCHHN